MATAALIVFQRSLRTKRFVGLGVSATTTSHKNLSDALLANYGTTASTASVSDTAGRPAERHRRIQVQVVHRHGDRTPITPLQNEQFWTRQMIHHEKLTKIAQNTRLVPPTDGSTNTHNANGRGPFGKLTELGLLQMVGLGTQLREMLAGNNRPVLDAEGRTLYPHIWHTSSDDNDNKNSIDHLEPSESVRVISTNFLRTIQSVQGVLVGLFPDGTKAPIDIDIRHTNWMIPDPQPRHTPEQTVLEQELSVRPHVEAKEQELLPLAMRATTALQDLLADDAREANFGVPQKQRFQSSKDGNTAVVEEPLSWNQLAEITKCLAVRELLPPGLSTEDQEAISKHAAWRWFESFRHPRLVHLAMGRMATRMVESLEQHSSLPPLTIWSAHDSTLIGLMCAFRLEQPAVWPEYGSYLMLELIEVNEETTYVRFSLNGETLKSQWDGNDPLEMIPLATLAERIRSLEHVTADAS